MVITGAYCPFGPTTATVLPLPADNRPVGLMPYPNPEFGAQREPNHRVVLSTV